MDEQQILDLEADIAELMQNKIDLKQEIDLIEKEIMENLLFLIKST